MSQRNRNHYNYRNWLQSAVEKLGRIQFIFISAYVGLIVVYDAFSLITPNALLWRWVSVSVLLVAVTTIWYAGRSKRSQSYYSWLLYGYIVIGILFAAVNVYTQRGMASKAVMLFVLPILYSAMFLRRSSIFFVATLSATAYVLASMWYAINNPSEGYKVELYGEVAFYGILLYIIASLLWILIHSKKTS